MDPEDGNAKWETLCSVINKLDEEIVRLKWPQLETEVGIALSTIGSGASGEQLFWVHQYLMRLLWRVRSLKEPQAFNKVRHGDRIVDHHEVPCYEITNYTFKAFRYAISKGQQDYVSNTVLSIPIATIEPEKRRAFEKSVQEN